MRNFNIYHIILLHYFILCNNFSLLNKIYKLLYRTYTDIDLINSFDKRIHISIL